MRVVYPICCGIDVHKSFLVATIIQTNPDGLTPHYFKKRFSTFNRQILALKEWLISHHCYDVCMESTGKYWIPVFNLLEADFHIVVANPKWVKAVKGNKDDVKDSKWIGDLFRMGLVPASFIPSKDIRVLREYTRYRFKVTSMRSSEKNRTQNALTVGNIALDSVVSDMFGKSATRIREYLLTGEDFDPEHCLSLLHGSMLKKSDQILESIEGFSLNDAQKTRIRLITAHMDYLDTLLQSLDQTIDQLVQPLEPAIILLCTIPGVKRQSAIQIISEIGLDMSQFESNKRLNSWAGLTPGNNESAGKKKSVRTSRAGVYLKPALIECALAAVQSKEQSYYSDKFQRIMKRRGKKRAYVAIARMLLTAVYHMLSTGEVWNPVDLKHIEKVPEMVLQKRKEVAIQKALQLLTDEGILPDDSQVAG